MISLLLSIACSTILILGFKLFERYKVDTFHAIVVNYLTCVAVGLPLVSSFAIDTSSALGWIPLALLLGAMFISLFFLIGVTTQKMGVSVSTVAMKLGLVLPIILAFTFYGEQATTIKLIGIALTLIAVVLTSYKKRKDTNETNNSMPGWMLITFPLVIFIGSGLSDSIVQYTEKTFFKSGGFEIFTIILFATAAFIGILVSAYLDLKEGKFRYNKKNVIAGILLGIPNYGSIYFLFRSLGTEGWESSTVFPVNNICIVLCSTLLAVILFREKLSVVNMVGLVVAIISIVLLAEPLMQSIQQMV